MEVKDSKVKKFCLCGCGAIVPKGSKWIKTHNIKYLHEFGVKASHWKGGIRKDYNGYMLQYAPEHHFSDKDGYIYQHRLIWEKHHNACLLSYTDIHHKNRIKHDNRIENLEAMNKFNHEHLHHKQDLSHRLCILCHNKSPENYRHWAVWFRHPITKEEWLCRKCYRKIRYKLGLKT